MVSACRRRRRCDWNRIVRSEKERGGNVSEGECKRYGYEVGMGDVCMGKSIVRV